MKTQYDGSMYYFVVNHNFIKVGKNIINSLRSIAQGKQTTTYKVFFLMYGCNILYKTYKTLKFK